VERSSAAHNEKSAPSKNDSVFAAPQISLPKGGGAIRGIGEKFAAFPSNILDDLWIVVD